MQKLAIITGASSGIGKSAAELFLQNNYQVINVSRSSCELESVINLSLDLSTLDFSSLKPYLSAKQEIVLVHNAAFFCLDQVQSIDKENLQTSLTVNVVAPSILNQLVLPYMQKNSSIIYIGSTLATKAVKGVASYSISKHALVGLMRATCQDLAGENIHTCCICPGFTDTTMFQERIEHNAKMVDVIKAKVTLGRLATSGELSGFIYYASQNPIINGAVLHANLGQVEV